MTGSVDPAAIESALGELDAPTCESTRRFVRGPCPVLAADGRPTVARAVAVGSDAALVWFLGAHYPLNLVVEVARQPADGTWRALFSQPDAHARVALRLSSRGLTPDALTAALGIAPSREAPAGISFDGRTKVARDENLWLRDVLPDSPASVEDKLQALLDVIEPRRDGLAALGDAVDASVQVAYHADIESMQGVVLAPVLLGRLGSLGLSLDLDLYAERLGTPPSDGS